MREIPNEGRRFLRTCFERDDWTALLVKNYNGGRAAQRVGSLDWACSHQVQQWLIERNAARHDVYASINAMAAGSRSRSRADVIAVRHVFLDLDEDAESVLRQVERRSNLAPPSYVVHTSRKRAHLLWRVRGFDIVSVERLQKRLAAELGGDLAATSGTQLTRLPGFQNHKYDDPYRVWVEYRAVERVSTPLDFPFTDQVQSSRPEAAKVGRSGGGYGSPAERARAYLSHVPPAVAGHHGDLHTFRTCCRIVRGFALNVDQAMAVLAEWNARCQPPWTARELREKIRSARCNGREPIGGLL